ncbi:hypothetical protein SAMN03097699_2926 [Flavobacteriaceae bacterium MAR_2010_188]|nr:hypothetical protein SAMN03097699_2926 [Flavobacteriaceae bacterium MAR_2010_188]
MIVNPQLFNYRLITGSLIIAIAVLSLYSFSNYKSSEAHEQFLEQEKTLISSELTSMLTQYEQVHVSNDLVSAQLEDAKTRAKIALDSIEILNGDIEVYSKYKHQISFLREQNVKLFQSVDSLNDLNDQLVEENNQVTNELKIERAENVALREENDELSTKIEIGSKIYVNNLAVKAFTNSKGIKTETRRAVNAEDIEVCLTLTENVLAEAGNKQLYIQIVNPKNNVVADKGAVTFGEQTLIYSAKNIVYYDNKAKDICVTVKADPDDRPLEKGLYYVSVFHNERKIAGTKIILD